MDVVVVGEPLDRDGGEVDSLNWERSVGPPGPVAGGRLNILLMARVRVRQAN